LRRPYQNAPARELRKGGLHTAQSINDMNATGRRVRLSLNFDKAAP